MGSTVPQTSDTSPDVSARVIERWRAMSPTEKLDLVDELNRACTELATAGVRQRHPDAGADEVRMRVIALSVPRELMVAAYGWDPETEGY